MDFVWSDTIDGIVWDELSELYRIAPLANKSAAHLQTVFANSRFKLFVFDRGTLIGAGRAIADGLDCSYICDVAVLPAYQGKGLGRELVGKLVQRSRGHGKILLYTVPGAESFYSKLGFKHMATAMAIFENEAQAIERGYLVQ